MHVLAKHKDLLTAYTQALKRKTGAEDTRAFDSILKESRTSEKLQTDVGKEFFNKTFEALMKKWGIHHFATASNLKMSVIERFNRTLKTRMWRYFTAKNTRRYIDVLQELLESHSNGYHKSIKMAVTSENASHVSENPYGTFPIRPKDELKRNFKEGDLVKISKLRGVYEQSYIDNLFMVSECIPCLPPCTNWKIMMENLSKVFLWSSIAKSNGD